MKNVITPILSLIWIISNGLNGQTVQDIDGNIYPTITSDSITWMAENLRTTRYNDGTKILLIEDRAAWAVLTQPAYCWLYNDETKNMEIGALYNWYTVETGKLCPIGWHVPSDRVFTAKAPWPSGQRDYTGFFSFTSDYVSCWTSTEESTTTAFATQIMYDGSAINRYYSFKNTGLLVRCK